MSSHTCLICGYRYDDAATGVAFEALDEDWVCPVCGSPRSLFRSDELTQEVDMAAAAELAAAVVSPAKAVSPANPLALPTEFVRYDRGIMDEIHFMAENGHSMTDPMETQMAVPGFADVLFLGAQLATQPLMDNAEVDSRCVIGRKAAKPLRLSMPIYVSHMSYGALSAEAKTALARGSAMVGTAECSGEGGILPQERAENDLFIFEYIPNRYSATDENLKASGAIEIKIGQGTKPGMGGHLPGAKVTADIAAVRGKPVGQDIKSPSCFAELKTPADLKAMVDELRRRSEGRPIGVKISAGHIEKDLDFIRESGCDFITIDGRGGATGSSPKFLRDASTVPTIYALDRAVRFMQENEMEQELVITGGLRSSGDVVKALAMGATAVALASAPLMAMACQRYRVCHLGTCPMGIATQDPSLRSRLSIEVGAKRVANFLKTVNDELKSFCRCAGHASVQELSLDDIVTTSSDLAQYTRIAHC